MRGRVRARLKIVFVLVFVLSGLMGFVRAQVAGGSHSPHGSLAIPCQNCHTANGWRPIRAVPEFDHNQTRYPLRGMHTTVACTQCQSIEPVADADRRLPDRIKFAAGH